MTVIKKDKAMKIPSEKKIIESKLRCNNKRKEKGYQKK